MIPLVRKLAPTVVQKPGYKIGKRYFPSATKLTPGQIYSSATLRHQSLDGMTVQADYSANIMPIYGAQVRTPVSSGFQMVNHYQYHFWSNLKWYWRSMRWSLPEMSYAQTFNQMGKQLPGQPMIMTPAPRYTKVLNAPRYNTVPSGVSPYGSLQPGTNVVNAQSGSVVGKGAIARRRFFNSAPFKAVGPDFHG